MVNLITFSPTHTSKHVGGAIAEGTGLGTQRAVDLTLEEVPATTIEDDELAVVTVPVYGGLVAPLALERLERVHGNGGPAVAVVVYGNRAYEKALEQLSTFLARAGFKVVAAGTFVGEHSRSARLYGPIPHSRRTPRRRRLATSTRLWGTSGRSTAAGGQPRRLASSGREPHTPPITTVTAHAGLRATGAKDAPTPRTLCRQRAP